MILKAFTEHQRELTLFCCQAPNVVTLLVEAGRNLRPPGSRGLCDPVVSVKCGNGSKAKFSKAQRKTNNPRWHFEVHVANSDPSETVIIEVSGNKSKKGGGRQGPGLCE